MTHRVDKAQSVSTGSFGPQSRGKQRNGPGPSSYVTMSAAGP